jgi:tetratricopeptide (TPR) repeat protein
MGWRFLALIVLMGLVVGTGPGAQAQGADELAALNAQVSELYNQGKYAQAVPLAKQYVATARQKHGEDHTEYADAISWLAHVYRAQGRFAEAEPLYKRSLAIRENALGCQVPFRRYHE